MGAGPYGSLYEPVFFNLIQLANPLLKFANVCSPLDLHAVVQGSPVESQWPKQKNTSYDGQNILVLF